MVKGCVCLCVCAAVDDTSPYSSVVEHPLSKRKVGSSILPGGKSLAFIRRTDTRCLVRRSCSNLPFVSTAYIHSRHFCLLRKLSTSVYNVKHLSHIGKTRKQMRRSRIVLGAADCKIPSASVVLCKVQSRQSPLEVKVYTTRPDGVLVVVVELLTITVRFTRR